METGVFVSSRILTLRSTGEHCPPLQWASNTVVCRALLGDSFSSGHGNLRLLKRGTIWSRNQSPGFLSKDTTQHILPRQGCHSLVGIEAHQLSHRCGHNLLKVHPCPPVTLSGKEETPVQAFGPTSQDRGPGEREPRLGSGSMRVHQSNGLRSPVRGCGGEEVVPASAQEKGGCPSTQDPAPAWVQVWGCTQGPAPCLLSKQYTTGFPSFKGKHNYQWNWKLQTSK